VAAVTKSATLALDDLLSNLTAEQVTAFRSAIPTAMLDQLDAAAADVWAHMHATGPAERIPLALTPADHPGWLRLPLLDTFVNWIGGKAATCVHDPHPDRPQPVVAAAWRPGTIACTACEPFLFALRRGSEADRRCDGCGKVTRGPAADDGIYPVALQAGPMLYRAGVCRDCRYWPPEES
jgi:hypothetical protein